MFWKRKDDGRKERSDKKVHVGPTISVKLKEEIERLAFILGQPVKDVGVFLFMEGIHEREVMGRFTPYFQRGILRIGQSLYYGHADNPSLRDTIEHGETDRISIRFEKRDFEDVQLLADLLDVSPSKAVGLMLDSSIRHMEIIGLMLQKHNKRYHFDEITLDEMRKLMTFIDRKNPYKANWNQALADFVLGATRKLKKLKHFTSFHKFPEKAVDHETYNWDLD